MNETTIGARVIPDGTLHFPFEGMPKPGEAMAVAPGVYWLRMPLPFALNHINLWLIEDDGGVAIVDTGINAPEVQAHWRTVIADVVAGRPVTRVIVTHMHPDHIGLAGWLCEEHKVRLWITRTEWLMHKMLFHESLEVSRLQAEFCRENGLGQEWLEQIARNNYSRRVTAAPAGIRRIQEGEVIPIGGRSWRVIVGTGHAPEHACLYCEETGVLISGDQILPKITPNVSLWANEREANPLRRYLRSLEKFRPLPEDTLVLPSHNLPFTGLHARLDQLARHHELRLAEIVDACDRPKTAAEIVPILFRRQLDVHQMGFAMGESLSHLAYLAGAGRLICERGSDGIYRYRRPG
ncbi:MAG TPA: MBL fold metallo-hydrolase [Alphaproteobacteria bacterium]|jgi:glyoxylase-like metal-dependent hydrolase (beta-lactamase superfamily II)|nr:MBL fold metallo-hydrolase [Alphaproteobacteria bacterium]